MPEPSAQPDSAIQFAASLSRPFAACGKGVHLVGWFEFARLVETGPGGDLRLTRRFDAVSISVRGPGQLSYRVAADKGQMDREELGRSNETAFERVYRGVLVGPGPLNNRLLTLTLHFTEQRDGTAIAEVVEARVESEPAPLARSNRG